MEDQAHCSKDLNKKSERNSTYCCVGQCSNYRRDGISFHHFPRDAKLKKAWEVALKMGKPGSASMRVCSEHFVRTDFFPGGKKKVHLKKNAIPSQKLPVLSHDRNPTFPEKEKVKAREERRNRRETVKRRTETRKDSNNVDGGNEWMVNGSDSIDEQQNDIEMVPEVISLSSKKDAGTQVDQEVFKLFYPVPTNKLTILTLLTNKESLYTFTGLHSFELLDGICKCLSDVATDSLTKQKMLCLRDRVVLTFVKLKLSLSFTAIGVLFQINRKSASNYFKDMVPLLKIVLETVTPWVDQEVVRTNMPICFKNYKNTRIVLDCAEVPIERSKCIKCRILTYSNYKKKQTGKWCVGVAPSGLITLITKAYGGRASDKLIVNQCGVLEKLDYRDGVMVDKGFMIENECLERHLVLYRPPFLSKKKKLTKSEALITAEIARARVHVERVIQRLREFEFLDSTVPWALLPYLDDVLVICAGIVNLSSPVLNIDKFL